MSKQMGETNSVKVRFEWIDWMKAIGIFLIVYGHFFSLGHWYVYSFSVPLFFMISGFLCKRENDNRVFWKKLWFNLVVPMVLISLINFGMNVAPLLLSGNYGVGQFVHFLGQLAFGFLGGLGTLWFVYTLILLKIILQFAPNRMPTQVALFCAFPVIGLWINHQQPSILGQALAGSCNGAINVCMAYPFFMMGFAAKRWKRWLADNLDMVKGIVAFLFLGVVLYFGTKANGMVNMYRDECGNNLALFLLNGLTGIAMIYLVSKWASKITPQLLLKYQKEL